MAALGFLLGLLVVSDSLPKPVLQGQALPVVTIIGDAESALRAVAGSGTLVSARWIAALQPISLEEVLRTVPGLYVRPEEGFGLRPNIGVRGLPPTRSTKVLLLEDGVPFTLAPYGDPATYYHPPLDRFASIEVLKGAAQILYGPQTIGGVINYLTRLPEGPLGGQLRLSGGTRAYANAHFTYGGTWAGGASGFLLDVLHRRGRLNREHTFSRITDLTVKAVQRTDGLGRVVLKLNAYWENSQVTYPGLTQAQFEENPYQNPFRDDNFRVKRLGAHLAYQQPLGGRWMVLSNSYGYVIDRHWWRQGTLVWRNGQWVTEDNSADPGNYPGVRVIPSPNRNDGRLRHYEVLGQELRLHHSGRTMALRHELDLGLRYHQEFQHRYQIRGDAPGARTGTIVEDNDRYAWAYSGFLQDRILWSDWVLTLGARLEAVRYRRVNQLGNRGLGSSGRARLWAFVPGMGLTYAPASGWTIFVGLHRGFAPPRVEDAITNEGLSVELDPELSWNAELGLRYQRTERLRFELTAFRLDFENQIIPASLAGGITSVLTNAGRTRHAGLELSARLSGALLGAALAPVSAHLAYTYLPVAQYVGERYSILNPRVRITGNRLPYAPEHLLEAGLWVALRSALQLGLEFSHVSAQFSDDLNTLEPTPNGRQGLIPAYWLWNLALEYRTPIRGLSLSGAVKNLTDALYIVDRSRGILVGTPRTAQLGIRWAF
ncbi:MAG: TonB-dependent receptor [Bacteroidetes bacterium]|nr:TonB-dependent receptor [Rhodothermia bacterium]MCS7155106.1 TonB-dependent receptor [Bacteroidota bacterium]MCX7907212.1 TonB-dependent receptor [Bacteroidota bacterium]MDW8138717.1 TonB-dependent receptor [Bacteroidota bacterium]